MKQIKIKTQENEKFKQEKDLLNTELINAKNNEKKLKKEIQELIEKCSQANDERYLILKDKEELQNELNNLGGHMNHDQ